MPNWVKRWFFEILPPYLFLSKPRIAEAMLRQSSQYDGGELDEENIALTSVCQQNHQSDSNLSRLNNYLKSTSNDKYPLVIQQAIHDIRYISETQRAAQQDDLVRLFKNLDIDLIFVFHLGTRRLEIHRVGYRSILFDSFYFLDDHRQLCNVTFRSVHLQ